MKDNIGKTFAEYAGVALIILIAFMLFLFTGCSTKYKQAKCRQWNCCPTVKDSTVTIKKDSLIFIKVPVVNPVDHANLMAYLKCDSLGQVYIQDNTTLNGRVISLEAYIRNNILSVTAVKAQEVDTAAIQAMVSKEYQYKEKIVEKQVNYLTKWQKFQTSAFWPMAAFILLILLYIAYRIYKRIRL